MRKVVILILLSLITGVCYGTRFYVCIDPGHCGEGYDPGALGLNGNEQPDESDFNLWIAQDCKTYLESVLPPGQAVILTRRSEHWMYVSPREKAKIANGEKTNEIGQVSDRPVLCAVSIHMNSSSDSAAHGTETYYYSGLPGSRDAAGWIHPQLWSQIGLYPYARNRGIKNSSYTFLQNCKMPACLVEVAFVSHPGDNQDGQWYQLLNNTDGFRDYAAFGIAMGILNFLEHYYDNIYLIPPVFLKLKPEGPYDGSYKLEWLPSYKWRKNFTYSIYRRGHPQDNYSLIASGIIDTFYLDNTLTSNKTYSYYIVPVDGSQRGPRSDIITIKTPPFSSNFAKATGFNNLKRVIFDNNGLCNITFSSRDSMWFACSYNYGFAWTVAHLLETAWDSIATGLFSALALDRFQRPHIVGIGCPGAPDIASGEDTSFVIFYNQYGDSGWQSFDLYNTHDRILSVSFAIDPSDTGWVLFNTQDNTGHNQLRIGRFCTQSRPDSLINIVPLDTYAGNGIGALGIKSSDRSIHVVFEKEGKIVYLYRDCNGNWSTPKLITYGYNPSISIAGDLIHFIWVRDFYWYQKIQTCYTDGHGYWSKIQDIARISNFPAVPPDKKGRKNRLEVYPYLEKGSIAVWSQPFEGCSDVYSSYRTESGNWTKPQNISQTSTTSMYPQVAMYQTLLKTRLVYVWTEDNSFAYEVKIKPVTLVPDAAGFGIPLYAFKLGQKKPCVFTVHRAGYTLYSVGDVKSADYDENYLLYRIKGLNPDKIYHINLKFYQDENNEIWKEGIEIDDTFVKAVKLPRAQEIMETIILSPDDYKDGEVELKIKRLSGPRVVLSSFTVQEYSKGNEIVSLGEDFDSNISGKFSIFIAQNPAREKVKIQYQLAQESRVSIKIFSVTGRCIRTFEYKQPAGTHTLIWDGKNSKGDNVPNGVYFLRIECNNKSETKKIIFLK